ncbi:biogenesis of lysosome-related organelles complex 1 subunit 6 isoform 1-T1 [Cariama cristata]
MRSSYVLNVRLRPLSGPSDASPDEGVVEDLPLIDEKAVEQLTEGLISHYLPDLQRSKSALQELTQNQVVLLETLEQEISKFKECNSILDINALEENQPVQIFGTNCCWRVCGTSILPLNRKGTGKKEQAQSASGSKSGCSKPVAEANISHFSVGLRLQREQCASLQTSGKGA